MIDSLIAFLNAHPEYLLLSIFIVAMCESLAVVGIIVPGVGLITAISVLAGHSAMPILLLVPTAMLGAFLGDIISFFIGRFCQPYLPKTWPFTTHPQWIKDGEHFFERHGGKSIFFGRFIGPIRPFIPMVAGMMKMNIQHFLLLNGLSAIAWGCIYVMPAYYLGEALDIKWLFSWQGITILIAISAIAILVSMSLKRKKP